MRNGDESETLERLDRAARECAVGNTMYEKRYLGNTKYEKRYLGNTNYEKRYLGNTMYEKRYLGKHQI